MKDYKDSKPKYMAEFGETFPGTLPWCECHEGFVAAMDRNADKVARLEAVILALKQEISLCEKLRTAILDPQGQASARGCYLLAERILKIAKGESNEWV